MYGEVGGSAFTAGGVLPHRTMTCTPILAIELVRLAELRNPDLCAAAELLEQDLKVIIKCSLNGWLFHDCFTTI